jgi:hypothetical protein
MSVRLAGYGANRRSASDTFTISLEKGQKQIIYAIVGFTSFIDDIEKNVSLAAGIQRLSPNPFNRFLTVRYIVPHAFVNCVRFRLVNLQGKTIWAQTISHPQPGIHENRIFTNSIGTSQLPAGVYVFEYTVVGDAHGNTIFRQRLFCL